MGATNDTIIHVSIVEDDPDLFEGLRLLLDGSPGFTCLGAYSDAERAIAAIPEAPPDVLLLDIALPGQSGIEAIPALRQAAPDMDILMLSIHDEDRLIFDALCAGACGYLVKTTAPQKILSGIREIRSGGAPMNGHIARRVIQSFRSAAANPLTRREQEILRYLCEGHSYKMISAELSISTGTVHTHIKNIYRKLQVRSNSEAVARAIQDKLV